MVEKYKGKLNEPLPPYPDLLSESDPDEADARYSAEVSERLELLFEHHGISGRDRRAWVALATALAKAHVPGLRPPEPKFDPDLTATIFIRMYYLIRIKGLSERHASEEVSRIIPELGKAERIRSYFQEIELSKSRGSLFSLLDRVEKELGKEPLAQALEAAIGEKYTEFRDITPKKRGRPKQN